MIQIWLPGSEQLSLGPHSDPDATIDFTSNYSAPISGRVGSPNSIDDNELVIPIMYNDPELIRIVYLLRESDADIDKARILVQKFQQVILFLLIIFILGPYYSSWRLYYKFAYCLLPYPLFVGRTI